MNVVLIYVDSFIRFLACVDIGPFIYPEHFHGIEIFTLSLTTSYHVSIQTFLNK